MRLIDEQKKKIKNKVKSTENNLHIFTTCRNYFCTIFLFIFEEKNPKPTNADFSIDERADRQKGKHSYCSVHKYICF